MSYKIAVGSTDGILVDLKFGEVEKFIIYEVDGTSYKVVENRDVSENEIVKESAKCCSSSTGCSGNGHGCGGESSVAYKVEAIKDCRAVLCKKIGFQAQKQFEKKAISVFDIECLISEALDKISSYYDKLDRKKIQAK